MSQNAATHEFETVINAPLPKVWHVLAEQFHQIDVWASGIPESWVANVTGAEDAPITGRVCKSSLAGFDDVTETIIEYGEDPYYFTYRGSGMPSWMGVAMNTWHVEAIDEETTLVYFEPEVQSAGLAGRILMPIFMLVGRRLARETLDDLKVYVETGNPSKRKRKKLAKAQTRNS